MDSGTLTVKFFSLLEGESPILQFIGKWSYKVYDEQEFLAMYIHMFISAIIPIYIGSHASLHRPPSAEKIKSSSKENSQDDDEIELEPVVEGLTPGDAVLFPLLAGVVLSILYFIIQSDFADILNQIFGYYFSAIGILGVGNLVADSFNVAITFVFPTVWSSGKDIYCVDPLLSQQVTGVFRRTRTQLHRKFADKTNPFPGILSNIKFSDSTTKILWSIRALLKTHWVLHGYLHGVFNLKSKVQLSHVIGFTFGLAASVAYNITKVWWLTNLMGFGAIYGVLQIMSPTTFWTGTLVLTGLFFYDIIMVFYTPMMVTVATKLDAPIKLVFPGPKRGGMIGLGDIVLPGIMMALALRFDLYLHYQRRNVHAELDNTADKSSLTKTAVRKPAYVQAAGIWGERFWTRKTMQDEEATVADGGRFPKTYFKASVVGYIIGMSVTVIVLNVYNHAQPALLYLVPGVLISLWGTAVVRGELKLMWEYTEDGSLESTKPENQKENIIDKKSTDTKSDNTDEEHAHHVFLISLSEPRDSRLLKKALLFERK